MNSKIANLLAKNITNDRVVADMIMFICNKHNDVEDNLIDLCLGTNTDFVTKAMVMIHINKIKPLCMQYMKSIEDVDTIEVVSIDNIARQAIIHFTAKITAWFKDQDSADKGDRWYANSKKEGEYKIKGTYTTSFDTEIWLKDIDLD